jgi:hypothetical protein
MELNTVQNPAVSAVYRLLMHEEYPLDTAEGIKQK